MAQINGVLGPINPDDLGFTLMHEHVLVCASGLLESYPDLLGDDREARAIATLKKAHDEGIDTMVDATTFDLGRSPELLRTVAEGSGVNIINVTGWWLDVPRFLNGVGPNQMAAEFIRDIEEGFRGTDIKAGVLKCAADFDGVTPVPSDAAACAFETVPSTSPRIRNCSSDASRIWPSRFLRIISCANISLRPPQIRQSGF